MTRLAAEITRELAETRDTQQYEVVQGFLDLDGPHYAGDRFVVHSSDPDFLVYRALEADGVIERYEPKAARTIPTAT